MRIWYLLMPLTSTAIDRLQGIISPQYERDVKELLGGRHVWKRTRDIIEVVSKVLGGLASIVAFGASSIKNPAASDWLSFTSGCIGTVSLTLMLFSNYSGRVSRLRTRELNSVLKYIGVTPVAQIASNPDAEEDDIPNDLEAGRGGGSILRSGTSMAHNTTSNFDASLLSTIKRHPSLDL